MGNPPVGNNHAEDSPAGDLPWSHPAGDNPVATGTESSSPGAWHHTRQRIFDAFARLFARENYADITVSQIASEATIGRSTFYDHYRSKEDLLDDLCADTFHHIASGSRNTLRDHGFTQTPGELMPALTHLLFHFGQDNDRLRGLLTGESSGLFLRKIEPYLRDLIREDIHTEDWESNIDGVSKDFVVNHIVGSFNAAVTWWVSQGFAQSPQTVAGYLETMLPDQITDGMKK